MTTIEEIKERVVKIEISRHPCTHSRQDGGFHCDCCMYNWCFNCEQIFIKQSYHLAKEDIPLLIKALELCNRILNEAADERNAPGFYLDYWLEQAEQELKK